MSSTIPGMKPVRVEPVTETGSKAGQAADGDAEALRTNPSVTFNFSAQLYGAVFFLLITLFI